ncbi:Fe2+-dependent dioxygenase [Sphingopyxis sp. QXT-31]|uniref:Fe2+-dependent dioxygenase n=1 Tax=Sphingopyxis sp. QXT-31 TaxID=1357916 RepID=UPI0009796555|nr:Fe2+-dependent dioxygenase [Sphingopyxis sp. QXT-31]APZ97889.1 Fe2+-dependent dioxygenase [Sphingopyxis sp. QXT-31]
MIRIIPDVLDADGVARLRAILDAAPWVDGNETSGPQAALAKHNQQLPEFGEAAAEAGRIVLDALGRVPLFMAAALPLKIYPPFFNRYSGGDKFADHIDNAIRMRRGSDFRIRSDLSATLFLCDPGSYEGGGLVIEGMAEAPGIKLPAGHLLLYPSSTVHRVEPITAGTRVASFMWIQSMIRDQGQRDLLFDLDMGVQGAVARLGQGDPAVVRLTGVYHNLLRRWADA